MFLNCFASISVGGSSLSWSYGSWIYIYLCSQCPSPLTLWVRILDWHWLAAGLWFSLGSPVSSTNEADRHNIADILLKVLLNSMTPTPSISVFLLVLFSNYYMYCLRNTSFQLFVSIILAIKWQEQCKIMSFVLSEILLFFSTVLKQMWVINFNILRLPVLNQQILRYHKV